MDVPAGGLGVTSIQDVNRLPSEVAEALYLRLVPAELFERFGIDRATLCDRDGARLVSVTAPPDRPWARIEVRASSDDRDPALLVDVETSPFAVPELTFVQIADPRSPRYGIDRDPDGHDTLFGTASRNLEEEERAMKDGLAPGQVRQGLRLLGKVLEAMEAFSRLLGHELYLIEPLFYHSAILYERRGCGYFMGREVMEAIDRGFAEDGPLRAALDSSTPFRLAGAEQSARGRSWALHDGISGDRWGGIKMYKAAGLHAGLDTFTGARY